MDNTPLQRYHWGEPFAGIGLGREGRSRTAILVQWTGGRRQRRLILVYVHVQRCCEDLRTRFILGWGSVEAEFDG